MKKQNVKEIYAQSSDIKSRSYIKYRKDMKKKAIAEFEIKDWLQEKLKNKLKEEGIIVEGEDVVVEKYGGDKDIWFLRGGGITREPDFISYIGENKQLLIEFQYSDREDLKYYDFKISKVAKGKKKKRIPYRDRIFFYIMKNSYRYAFITPEWITNNSEMGTVPAWGNRKAYRVPKEVFEGILEEDTSLEDIVKMIDVKIEILNFQHKLLDIWEEGLSKDLQKVVDEENLLKIIPKTLEGFFRVCFIIDHLNKIPENINLWLIYLLSYVSKDHNLTLKEISMLLYSLDYLYSKTTDLKKNELVELKCKIDNLLEKINSYYDEEEKLYKSDINESPLEETRYALFSINLIEDIIQDAIVYYEVGFERIKKIYQCVKNPIGIFEKIKNKV